MKTVWFKGLDKDYEKELRGDFASSVFLRKRLTEILNDKIQGSQKESRGKISYENSNWAYLQADARGYERAFSEIISLISSDTE